MGIKSVIKFALFKIKIPKVAVFEMHYIGKEKVLYSVEKHSAIWAEPNSRISAEQLGRTKCLVSH